MNNTVVKNTTMLYIMSIAKMVFPLLTLPYLTRILTTDAYGVVSYVKAVMQYMQIIVDFGFLLSGTRDIVKVKDNHERLCQETGDILIARVCLSVVAFIVLCVCTIFIPILNSNILYTFLSFIPVFLTCFLFDYFFRGIERMEIITIRFVVMKGISTVLTFVFVHDDSDILMIPLLDIFGSIVAVVLVLVEMKKLNIKFVFSGVSSVWKKIVDSAVYFASNMSTTVFSALNTLLVGIYLDTTQVAYWSVCMQMVSAVQALYSPLTNGIYPHMIKTRDFGVVKKSLKIYMPVIILGCVFTLAIADYALLIIGGSEYTAAANILRCLVPVLFFSFLSIVFGWPCLGAIGKEKKVTITTVTTAIIQILGLVVMIVTNRFTLVNIALFRGITEAFMALMRMNYCRKYKDEFVNWDRSENKSLQK